MGTVTKPNTWSPGNTIVSSEHNDNFDTIYNEFNGNIDNDNVDASAAIAASKLDLATIAQAISHSAKYTNTSTMDLTGSVLLGASPLVFEGNTSDGNETTVTVTDPTADRTVTVPDRDVTVGSSFVDRGDPTGWDFQKGDLTTDGTTNDLDLSSIVDAGASMVSMRVQLEDGSTDQFIRFRKNGVSNDFNASTVITQVASQDIQADVQVGIDSNGKIEYVTSNTTFDAINIVVKGWWF